jgi:hypothetical protein
MSKLHDLGIRLSVPFNHQPDLFDGLREFSCDIGGVYFPAPPNILASGRLWNGPPAAAYARSLPRLVAEIKSLNAEPELLLNAVWNRNRDEKKLLDFVRRMTDLGVSRVVAADLFLAMILRYHFPKISITASVIAFIHNNLRAQYWRELAGCDRIVIDTDINKRLPEIRSIADLEIEIMPANACMPSCPFQVHHYVSLCFKQDTFLLPGKSDFCKTFRDQPENAWRQYMTEIVPADMPRYQGLVKIVKISGRDTPTAAILSQVRDYCELTSRRHPTCDYFEPEEVFGLVGNCDRTCLACGRCREIFETANLERNRAVLRKSIKEKQ